MMTNNSQTFFGHMDEFRQRILKVVVVFLLSACVFYNYIDSFIPFFIKPVGHIVFTAPSEAFLAYIYLSLLGGFIISFPFTLYQIWGFVSLGLKNHERRYIFIFGPLSLVLFLVGALFAFFVVNPIAIKFLLGFSSDAMIPMITVNKYVSFVGTLILAFGVIFELPLVLAFLTKIGVATPAFLQQKRKHAIVLILVASALITPPDVITQLLMSGPLVLLYELGIVFSKMTYRKKNLEVHNQQVS